MNQGLANAAMPASKASARDAGGEPVEVGESSASVDRLLDDSWDERLVPYSRRQRVAGAAVSVAFLISAVGLARLAPVTAANGSLAMIAAVALGFAIASRVEFPIGAGYV